MITVTANRTVQARETARAVRVQAGVRVAALAAVVAAADAVVGEITRIAPRDTNRYLRGWQLAAEGAGKGIVGRTGMGVIGLRESRFAAQNFDRLARQVERLEKAIVRRQRVIERWYTSKGRKLGRWGRDRVKEIKKYEKLLVRAKEELRKIDDDEGTAIVIGRSGGRKLITVRTKVYGGTGRAWFSGGRAVVYLKNLEAHASIVEANTGTLAKAEGSAKPERRMWETFQLRLAAAAGTTGAGLGGGGRALAIAM